MERPYQEYYWDKRNLHKRTPAEIEKYRASLKCCICGKQRGCRCVPKRHHIKVGAKKEQWGYL